MKKTRRPAHARHTLQTARDLSAYLPVEGDEDAFALVADMLAAWARYMLKINPAAAGRLYLAVCDEWRDNRGGLYLDASDDRREQLTRDFHAAFLARLRDLKGVEPLPPTSWEQKRAVAVGHEAKALLDDMLARVWRSSGASAEPDALPRGDVWAELRAEWEEFIEDEGMVM